VKNFWLQIAVQEAIIVAEGVVAAQPGLTDAQKQALQALIAAGQAVSQAFGV
jgi:hypothetical protein